MAPGAFEFITSPKLSFINIWERKALFPPSTIPTGFDDGLRKLLAVSKGNIGSMQPLRLQSVLLLPISESAQNSHNSLLISCCFNVTYFKVTTVLVVQLRMPKGNYADSGWSHFKTQSPSGHFPVKPQHRWPSSRMGLRRVSGVGRGIMEWNFT